MHAVRHLALLLTLLLAAAGTAAAQEPPTPDTADVAQVKAAAGLNVPMRPVPPEMRAREGVAFDASQSRGVFIGINEFSDESVSDLQFAVDDAVDLAHQFYELQLIAPKGIILMLAGKPTKEESRARLEALRQAGAPAPIRPTHTAILRAMTDAAKASGPDGLFVASISTHGYYTGMDAIIAEDTIVDTNLGSRDLEKTSLTTARFTGIINSANAGRKLGLIDACRENLIKPAKGGIGGMSPLSDAAMNVLAGLEGVAVLTATKAGGFGFDGGRDLDDSEIRNGVFTHYVLQVLRNGTGDPNEETITLGRVAEAVDARMKAWTARRWREAVGIGKNETFGDWAALPLAMNPAATETMKKWRADLAKATETLGTIGARFRNQGLTLEIQGEIEAALGRLANQPRATGEGLTTRIEEVSDGRMRIKDFQGWWIGVGRIEYAAPTPTPIPIPAAQPTPTPAGAQATLPPIPVGDASAEQPASVAAVAPKPGIPGIRITEQPKESISRLEARAGVRIAWEPTGESVFGVTYSHRLNDNPEVTNSRRASVTLTELASGRRHTFQVRAVTAAGASEAAVVSFEVRANEPPTVRFAEAPTEGALIEATSVSVRLDASDADGQVQDYTLELNGTEVGGRSTTGEFTLTGDQLSDGPQQIIARAYDDANAESAPVLRGFRFRYTEATPTPSPTPVPTRTPRPTASPTPAGPVVETKIGGRDALVVTLPKGTTMNFIRIPGGTFDMGSNNGDNDEKPVVENVRITPFWMAETEVTVGQFKEFIAANPRYKTTAEVGKEGSSFAVDEKGSWGEGTGITWREPGFPFNFKQTDDHPVVLVSHHDAAAFAQWLSTYTGREFRLPYESQWEYACRAGSTTDWFWGTDPNAAYQYANIADQTAKKRFSNWTTTDTDDGHLFTSPVKSYRPNGFGLYDTSGNVWEWCLDWYDSSAYNSLGETNPVSLKQGSYRVIRGGSWGGGPRGARSADRNWYSPGIRCNFVGFRVCSPNAPPLGQSLEAQGPRERAPGH